MTIINKNIPIIILAGGKGERFVNKDNLPKQLAKVSNHPIIIEIIYYYFKNGFNTFLLPLGYKQKFFTNFFKNKINIKKYKLNIVDHKKLNIVNSKINILFFNAGITSNKLSRIRKSIKYFKKENEIFGVCYGDIFANINFNNALSCFKNKKIEGLVTGFQENSPYGHLKVMNKKILNFNEKPLLKDPINIGFYFFRKKIFSKKNFGKNYDLEKNFLPKLSKFKKLACYMHKGYHFTVNSQKDLVEAKQIYKKDKDFFKKL